MIAIVAVDRNWGIGYKGDLLISLPEDQRGVFRKYTSGCTVIYGRKTLMTFKEQNLLPKRVNIIMSRNPFFEKEGAIILHSVDDVKEYVESHKDETVFVIGGEEMYKTLLPLCDKAIVTFINEEFTADAYFPNLDKDVEWQLDEVEEEVMSEKGVSFNVRHYSRK